MAGRHRKVSPVRQRVARITALVSLTGATGLPAAALLSHAAADSPHGPASAEADRSRPVSRAPAHTVSRSGDRLAALNLVEARQAAEDQRREALERAARRAREAREAREAKRRQLREKAAKSRGFLGGSGDLPDGVSFEPCSDGSGVESGLTPNAVKVYRAVCNAFPAISSWGGRSGRGEHAAGRALDIMISGDAGWRVAEYVRRHARVLGVSEVIYAQRIWTVQRSGEGWRAMEDRGSTTANHYDHVHVTVY